MSARSAESRENSPDASTEKRTSKKRKVLSCYACRDRKMKCDRVYPVCGRCQKAGKASQCTYDPRLVEALYTSADSQFEGKERAEYPIPGVSYGPSPINTIEASALAWNSKLHEQRLIALEQKLATSSGTWGNKNAHISPLDGSDDRDLGNEEEMAFRGKGLNTRFYGSTSPYSLIAKVTPIPSPNSDPSDLCLTVGQFRELQSFTREAIQTDTAMLRIRTDFKSFRARRKIAIRENQQKIRGTDEELLDIIPRKGIVDAAVDLYFNQVEYTYRILHEPSFRVDYQCFWQPQEQKTRKASFAALLTLIVALSKCLSTDREVVFVGDRSAQRESAAHLIEICDAWLVHHPRNQLNLEYFQLQCLSLLAKRANSIKMKQAWVYSGDVMRLAIAAGLHRKPEFISQQRISEFEKEMRRRLWATVVELELQASIDSGLPSSMCGLYTDVQPPSNTPDDLFSLKSGFIPSQGLDRFTRSSYLAWSTRSLPLRVKLVQLLNNPTTKLPYAEVLAYDSQLHSMVSSLPNWDESEGALPSALLDLELRQFLLMLHRPYAKLAAKDTRFSYSFAACVNAANSMISIHDDLRRRNVLLLNHLRIDVFRVITTLAQIFYHSSTGQRGLNAALPKTHITGVGLDGAPCIGDRENQTKGSNEASTPPIEIPTIPHSNFFMTTLCNASVSLMESAISSFEDKTMRLGTGYMEFWLTVASIGLMPSTAPSVHTDSKATRLSSLSARVQTAIDRFTTLCFRVLALQKDPGTEFASSLRSNIASAAHTPSEMQSITTPAGRSTPIVSAPDMHTSQTYIESSAPVPEMLDSGGKGTIGDGLDFGMQEAWETTEMGFFDLAGWDFSEFWTLDHGGGG
jgi:hypothetical protein